MIVVWAGCVFGESSKEGGEACRADQECQSRSCYGGVCSPGECSGHDEDCPQNYKCLYDDGDPIFGFGDGYYCARSCEGGCPERWECSTQSDTCYFDGPEVTVTFAPEAPRAHERIELTAMIAPDIETTFEWHVEDLAGNRVGDTVMGESCEQTLDAGDYRVLVRWDTTGYGATDGVMVHVCAVAGDPCTSDATCCAGLACPSGTCN